MAYYKTIQTVNKEIFYVPCLNCGSENIDFNDCNYSSFNMCYGRCKDCGHESSCGCDISPSKESIIDFWNMNNDIDYIIKNKMITIDELQSEIKELKKLKTHRNKKKLSDTIKNKRKLNTEKENWMGNNISSDIISY